MRIEMTEEGEWEKFFGRDLESIGFWATSHWMLGCCDHRDVMWTQVTW